MTPGARAAASIELVELVEADRSRPADAAIASWFRGRRYAGGGDRRAIQATVYTVLRRRSQIDWWIGQAGLAVDSRRRVIAALLLGGDWSAVRLAEAFDGGRYRPAPLSDPEAALAAALAGHGFEDMRQPADVRGNIPDWLLFPLQDALGGTLDTELAALRGEATVDLRVNTLKLTRADAAARLAALDIAATPTPFSPVGLRLASRVGLRGTELLRRGLVEPQDEASQIAALLVEATPGSTVVDFCAGAGGKTLALAATMANRGRLVACDSAPSRLERARPRLRRAGVDIAEFQVLDSQSGSWAGAPPEGFDRVLVDAPCSGSGTWRRAPEGRWRLTPGDLDELVGMQARILDAAAPLVAPGGRLVYAVCSLLAEEGEAQVAAFLDRHAEFATLSLQPVWARTVGGECPAGDDALRLRPGRDGTDGFFVGLLERSKKM